MKGNGTNLTVKIISAITPKENQNVIFPQLHQTQRLQNLQIKVLVKQLPCQQQKSFALKAKRPQVQIHHFKKIRNQQNR